MRKPLVLGVVLTAIAAPAFPSTLHVPEDWPTIQAAVDAATAGDTVLVGPGTYTDRDTRYYDMGAGAALITACVFLKDGIVVASSGGPEVTTIDFGNQTMISDDVVIVGGLLSEGVTVRGFSVTSGPLGNGVQGMSLSRSRATVDNCRFFGLRGGPQSGAGVSCGRSSLSVQNCWFRDCIAVSGAALSCGSCSLLVEGCLVEECSGGSAPMHVSSSDTPVAVEIVGNVFRNNESMSLGGAGLVAVDMNGSVVIEGNVFEGNQSSSGGALYAGSASSTTEVTGNLFLRNSAWSPGGPSICGTVSNLVEKHKWRSLRVLTHPAPDGARRTGELRHGARYHVRRRRPIPS